MAFKIVSGVLGVALAAVALFSLSALLADDREAHRAHDAATAAVVGLLAVGYLTQLRGPERKIAPFQQVLVTLLAALISLTLGSEADPAVLGGVVGVLVVIVLLHPRRDALIRPGPRIDPALAVISVVALIPLVVYALDQAEIQRACPPSGDEHCTEVHWATMSTLALSLPLVGLVAALGAPAWRISAWSAGAAALLFGLASVAYGDNVSALDAPWAWAAIATGIAFVGIAEWRARRAEPASL